MNNIEYLKKYYKGNIEEAIERLNNGEAVQYIVGNVDFYGYTFNITHDTLMPRFETEELVNKLINYINKKFDKNITIIHAENTQHTRDIRGFSQTNRVFTKFP